MGKVQKAVARLDGVAINQESEERIYANIWLEEHPGRDGRHGKRLLLEESNSCNLTPTDV